MSYQLLGFGGCLRVALFVEVMRVLVTLPELNSTLRGHSGYRMASAVAQLFAGELAVEVERAVLLLFDEVALDRAEGLFLDLRLLLLDQIFEHCIYLCDGDVTWQLLDLAFRVYATMECSRL